jgi:hypothetical protein
MEDYSQNCARYFDKYLVRKMRREGGSYEMHMADGVHEFFSPRYYAKHLELRFKFNDKVYSFKAYVYEDYAVMDTTVNEVLELYPNVHALKSMLRERVFPSLHKWGAACQNAVGGNIPSMTLTRRLFAGGQCYENLILAAKAAREAAGEEVSELSGSDYYSEHSSRNASDSDDSSQTSASY